MMLKFSYIHIQDLFDPMCKVRWLRYTTDIPHVYKFSTLDRRYFLTGEFGGGINRVSVKVCGD